MQYTYSPSLLPSNLLPRPPLRDLKLITDKKLQIFHHTAVRPASQLDPPISNEIALIVEREFIYAEHILRIRNRLSFEHLDQCPPFVFFFRNSGYALNFLLISSSARRQAAWCTSKADILFVIVGFTLWNVYDAVVFDGDDLHWHPLQSLIFSFMLYLLTSSAIL